PLCQLAEGDLFGVVVILLLAGEPGGQDLAVLADDDRSDGERRFRRRAQPGQLPPPAQEPVVRAGRARPGAPQRDPARPGGPGLGAGRSRRGAAGSATKKGATARSSWSARSAARKSPRTRAPPSTRRRATPRSARS